ncbi:hypothetical protein BDZ94DRAFT_1306520 [Collybia nuda]|uniref:Nitrogen regulatory protein areA GATA-like domain-containing protein n=1 Tax=Collybia nuda TaxID=64659 RepID=A0A9P5Y9M0_9AGAR|nr:hypothetical protein BDZ94DRAFT_1306520 [Collybia nuda]
MANYLPVLLVSVAANSIPDDSSVSTLPRGQVDYLSHNWEEEDVWRSWRNMTRQKNEITNGVRLENASWRTWWKQRNGLGTVTPETLNWLKDSDVTWLYGPLHTAVDWTPPPKPIPEPTSALDLSTTHKPILKYRSISQLLTSDLHSSPHISPPQSDADLDDFEAAHFHTDSNPSPDIRPPLTHTKSDTYITRWGPSRTFRKESPPRIDPPPAAYSPTSLDTFFASSSGENSNIPTARAASPSVAGGQQKKRHISFNTFVEQCIAIEKPKNRVQYHDDDDDDEDEGDPDEDDYPQPGGRYPYGGRNAWGYDDGYEEDEEADSGDEEEEAVSLSMWDERYGGSAIANSDSDSCDGRDDDEPIEDVEDDTLHRRSPFRPANSARSQSKVSTTSSSSTASTSTSISSASSASTSASSSSEARERRSSTSTTSTYRPRITQPRRRRAPPLIRTPTTEREPTATQTHVTIAPIAPTILKTGGGVGEWVEGFGDEAGGSDDGLCGVAAGINGARWWTGVASVRSEIKDGEDEMGGESRESGTPVELVYVPPFGSNYSVRLGRDREREREREREYGARREVRDVMEDHEDGLGNGTRGVSRSASDQAVYRGEVQGVYGGNRAEGGHRRKRSLFSVGVVGDDEVDPDTEPPVVIPTVVVPREDAFENFEGSGTGDRGRRSRAAGPGRGREALGSPGDRSRSRSRSRSKSRTPSPAVSPSTSIDATPVVVPTPTRAHTVPAPTPASTTAPVAVPGLRRAASASPPITASALLAPPTRGRGSSSHQDLQQARGRSSTRTASGSGSLSTAGSSSSLGSLSPEGIVAGVGAGKERDRDGRGWRESRSDNGKDRDREGGRERSRGRDRTGKRLSTSVSPDDVLVPHTAAPPPPPVQRDPPKLNVVTKSMPPSSSASSSSASSTSSSATAMPATPAPMYRPYESDTSSTPISIPALVDEEEKQRYMHPTPSNSPVISMQVASKTGKDSPMSNSPTPTSTPTPTTRHAAKTKSPLSVPPPPYPAEPSTSYSISPPRTHSPSPSPSSSMSPRNSLGSSPISPASRVSSPPSSPRSPMRGDATIVGKAVGMVSSAGAYLGFWNGGVP